ncbi:hypothetical protein GCM10023189_53390 [Nibrella saemangeumensis]|uniref:Uncharacterized protein n=1 Tax=Nibrella saemangeumensis TaxID=1084526 RepID=A0ABP8NK72_9BACT
MDKALRVLSQPLTVCETKYTTEPGVALETTGVTGRGDPPVGAEYQLRVAPLVAVTEAVSAGTGVFWQT